MLKYGHSYATLTHWVRENKIYTFHFINFFQQYIYMDLWMDRTTLEWNVIRIKVISCNLYPIFNNFVYYICTWQKDLFPIKCGNGKYLINYSLHFFVPPPSLLLFYINITFFKRIWNVLSSHHYYVCVCVSYTYSPVEKWEDIAFLYT